MVWLSKGQVTSDPLDTGGSQDATPVEEVTWTEVDSAVSVFTGQVVKSVQLRTEGTFPGEDIP